jgi:hypothetical protein
LVPWTAGAEVTVVVASAAAVPNATALAARLQALLDPAAPPPAVRIVSVKTDRETGATSYSFVFLDAGSLAAFRAIDVSTSMAMLGATAIYVGATPAPVPPTAPPSRILGGNAVYAVAVLCVVVVLLALGLIAAVTQLRAAKLHAQRHAQQDAAPAGAGRGLLELQTTGAATPYRAA